MPASDLNLIEWENGWESISSAIAKLKRIVEGFPETQFNSTEYMMHYTTIHQMCTQKSPHNYSQRLYDNYKNTFEEYIHSTVLPNIRGKHDTFLLRELVNSWEKYKVMVKWMSHFFRYLSRFFIMSNSLPSLREVGLSCFRDLVYKELKVKIREAVIALINQEREGEQVERALLKNVLDIFVELGTKQMNCYETDFEGPMLDDSANYYSRKASNWIVEYSCPDYMIKAEECLEKERDRVSHYMCASTWPKLDQIMQNELLVVHNNQLIEKEHSGYRA